MGNSSSSGAIEVDDNPLRKEESESVKELFATFLVEGKVSKDRFRKEFESLQYPSFGDACFCYVAPEGNMTFELFQAFVINGARSTSTKTLQLLWGIIHSDPQLNDELTMEYFFRVLLEFSECEHNGIGEAASRLAKHAHHHARLSGCGDAITSRAVINWTNDFAPHAYKVFVTYLNKKCFSRVDLQSSIQFRAPCLEGGSAVVTQSDLMPLALYDTTLQGRWIKLYTTQADGLSFNRIAHHIMGYEGPTLILCEVEGSGEVIAAYNEDRWRDSNRFYGTSASFLCRITPTFKLLRNRSDSNGAYQWLNMKSYGMPHGLGMGGSLEKFRFYIPDTLEGCTACASCLTFEPGAMLEGSSDGSFSISIMEVWGCGGEELIAQALEGQAKDRGARDALINKARQVDKAAFAGNSFDQEFLLSKNFSHKVRMADESACHMTNVDDSDRKATSADSKH